MCNKNQILIKEMKICIVAPYLASKGGAGRFTWEFSEYLASMNDTVILVSLYTDRTLFDNKKNLKILDLADETGLTQSVKFWFNLNTIRKKLQEIVELENPEALLFMNFPATLWAQKFDKRPVLCYPHDISLLYTNTYIKNLSKDKYLLWLCLRKIIRIIDKKRWSNFDEVICNSNFSAKKISKTYCVTTQVIHPGTRTDIFKPVEEKKKAVLIIATQKAQRADFLIKSIRTLLKERNDFEVWIIGSSGEHDKELKTLVHRLGLTNKIRFFGKVSDEELIRLYSKALVAVHLVRQPPFGLIVTEALSCETPVIACKPGGVEEVIEDGKTGFLIDEDDSKQLITYIRKFLDEPTLSRDMGKMGRIRVQNDFEMKDKSVQLRKLILDWIRTKLES